MKKVTIFLVLLTITVPVIGQKFLVLEKMGTKKRYEYQINDKMSLRLHDEDFFTRITITDLADSLIMTENLKIDFSSINAVKLEKSNSFFKYSGPLIMMAGATLLAIDVINQTAVQGGEYQSSTGVYVTSAALIGVGAVFSFAGRDKVKLKKWWRIRTVNI